MNKAKVVFNQTLMVASAIVFGIGVQGLINYLLYGKASFQWPWYIPLSIILTSVLSALPSIILMDLDELNRKQIIIRNTIHFFAILGVVSFCGFIFGWYTELKDYLYIAGLYVIIYLFVWVATGWMAKSDEKKINNALKDFQDEE